MTRALRSTAFVVMIVAALAGCAAVGGSAAPTSTPTASAPPAPSPTPTTPAAQVAECEALLTPEKNAEFASEGRALTDPALHFQWSPPMQELVDAGAAACMWAKPAGHLYDLVAQLVITEDEAASWIAELAAAGWTQTDDPVAGTWVAPRVPELETTAAAVYSGGVLYLANYPAILGSVAPLQ